MKKAKITLHGRIIHTAHRTFEIVVPDEKNVLHFDTNTLSDLADEARAVWQISEFCDVIEDEHSIDSVTDAEERPSATLDINDPRIAKICSIFGIDPTYHDSGMGDEPSVSF